MESSVFPRLARGVPGRMKAMPRKRAATVLQIKPPKGAGPDGLLHASASSNADHDLARALPYLIARAGTRMGQAFSKELKRFHLSLTEWRVCVALHHQPHQRLSELASHTSTEPSTLSRVVDGLLQRGLLVRDRSGED